MWSRLWNTEGKWKTGAHQVNNHGLDVSPKNPHATPELQAIIWKHAMEMTGEPESV